MKQTRLPCSIFRKYAMPVFVGIFCLSSLSFADNPPASQTAGALLEQRKNMDQQKRMERQVKEKRSEAQDIITPEVIAPEAGAKVLVTKIIVSGATLIKPDVITKVTARFEGKQLSLTQMQKVADLITDEYRQGGYVTSRAYIPPQTVKDGILNISVIEGLTGQIEIKGNRFFKKSVIRRKIDLRPNGYFDFTALQKSLTFINEHPDRTAKAVLVPGKERGTTDIIIDVKDRLPVHAGYTRDNYLSRYLGEQHRTIFAEHNNLLGFDDKLRVEWQESRDSWLNLIQGRYSFPLQNDWILGFYGQKSKTRLGREFEILDSRGESMVLGVYTSKALVNKPDLDIRLNAGFDYKNVENYLLGNENSRDRLRVAKTGLDLDFNDPWARNIITAEIDQGFADIMNGMAAHDSRSSRSGAGSGADFQKWVFNYFRLQPGPFMSEILLKNSAQVSNNDLVAGEQFQAGGPGSVRGYPVGEFAGDAGYYSSVELAVPPYLFSRETRVPFMKNRTVFESFRIVGFFDHAQTMLNTPGDEDKNRILNSAGFGFRMDLGDNFRARIEVGYPVGNGEPSDNRNAHPWFELTAKF